MNAFSCEGFYSRTRAKAITMIGRSFPGAAEPRIKGRSKSGAGCLSLNRDSGWRMVCAHKKIERDCFSPEF